MSFPSIPSPAHAFADAATGKIDPVWYNYLRNLDRLTRTATATNVVQTVSVTEVDVETSTFTDLITASITPSSASSKVLIIPGVSLYIAQPTAYQAFAGMRITRNGVSIFNPNAADSGGPYGIGLELSASPTTGIAVLTGYYAQPYLDSPATTAAVTYAVQGAAYSGCQIYAQINDADGHAKSTLTLLEIPG